jgi:predicted dehydrogenase
MSAKPAVRAAVIGVGYLGRFHAQKWAAMPDCQLVAVADASEPTRMAVAAELKVAAVADWRQLIGQVDAVSIAASTPSHYTIARECLRAGIHVLVEKPITTTVAEAAELIEVAAAANCILQVGHLERFNEVILALDGLVSAPRFIESARLAPFKLRGTDVSVVLDLMIHDIDLIQSIVNSPIVAIDAIGRSVFSDDIDIANARLTFASGCVANVTASRISMKSERKLRLFEDEAYLSIDMQQKVMTVIRRSTEPPVADLPQVSIDERSYDQGDALKAEIAAFVHSVRTGAKPRVSGQEGLAALETAIRIAELVRPAAV